MALQKRKSKESYVSSIRGKKLNKDFYLQDTLLVAKQLLGKYLYRKYKGQYLIGKIVETEAYREDDPASHAFKGKTKRNEVMFWEGGHLYVYFTYGMHYCCNVVTEREGRGCAVLIRAVEPIEGLDTMMKLRKFNSSANVFDLTNGPAKLCQAFNITKRDNGKFLCDEEIFIVDSKIDIENSQIGKSQRIGIKNGLDKQWRFFIRNSPWVSRT